MLKGLDISTDMIKIAEKNAEQYGLTDRVEYVLSSDEKMVFEENRFDAVFTNGSLHEMSKPQITFDEILAGGETRRQSFHSDLRRDMSFLIR